jgi:hypothetical protein
MECVEDKVDVLQMLGPRQTVDENVVQECEHEPA